jgi:hypothetical protein
MGPGQISELATANAHIAIGVKHCCTLACGLSTVKQLICLATEVSAICNENGSLSPSQNRNRFLDGVLEIHAGQSPMLSQATDGGSLSESMD